MREPPVCLKCGKEHFNVYRCDGTHIKKQPKVDSPPVQWGESMEGFSTFGNASENFSLLGGSTLLRKEE